MRGAFLLATISQLETEDHGPPPPAAAAPSRSILCKYSRNPAPTLKPKSHLLLGCFPSAPTASASSMAEPNPPPAYSIHHSCCPDCLRDRAWRLRRRNHRRKQRRGIKGINDDDVDELKASLDLGFGFESDAAEKDPHLADAFPALRLYHAITKQYSDYPQRRPPTASVSESDAGTTSASLSAIFDDTGDDPKKVKARLKQWAKVAALAARQEAASAKLKP